MFMWLQRTPSLDSAALCSGERSLKDLVDRGTSGEVLLKTGLNRLFC